MKQQTKIVIAVGAILLLIMAPQLLYGSSMNEILSAAARLIAGFEGFSPVAYWDKKRWSIGYGTAAAGPDSTITEPAARKALADHSADDFAFLEPRITRPLTTNQWAAILSFTYQEGQGAAANLIADLNAGDDAVLEEHFKRYVYAGGQIDIGIVDRRNQEWALFVS